uniref:Calcitonin-like diuretic hormone n=1 Tax=Laodelphax striatellus TaxID=195883 RepID=A0A345BED5_LAOST|nr:calcitonin-like diuretic hormone [Laodelphax striatellus]
MNRVLASVASLSESKRTSLTQLNSVTHQLRKSGRLKQQNEQLSVGCVSWSAKLSSPLLSESAPFSSGHKGYLSDMESEPDPELMLEILTRLGQTIIRANDLENSKRGLDLGLSRGFSGSQAA